MRVNIYFFAFVPAVLGFPNFFWSSSNTTTSYTVPSTTESSSVQETGSVVILNIPTETTTSSIVSTVVETTTTVVYTYETTTTVDQSVVILNIPTTVETTTTEIPETTEPCETETLDGSVVILSIPTTSSIVSTTETSTTSEIPTPTVVYTYETTSTVDQSVVILNIPTTSSVVSTTVETVTSSVVPPTTTTEICETTVDGSVIILNIPSTMGSITTTVVPTTTTTAVPLKTVTSTITSTLTTVIQKTIEIFQTCTTTTSSWVPKITPMVYSPKKNSTCHRNSTCPIQPVCVAKESFCSSIGQGNITTNGTQVKTQSCSNTPMGTIPSFDNMISTLIRSPVNGAIVLIDQNITVRVQAININYGFFEDPVDEYYVSPQQVGANGNINGHTHVVIEKILDGGNFPDPRTPLFFEGLNDPSDETNSLSALVLGSVFTDSGPGTYRICTITASQGHQPVLLPVARRGSTDDCIRIIVI